jgi:hypothetical protein
MSTATTPSTKVADWIISIVLVVVPFHAFLTVWGSSLIGHYGLLRLWDDLLLVALLGIVTMWLARDRVLAKWFFTSLLVRLIFGYVGLMLLLGVVSFAKGDVSSKALLYGLLVNLRFLAWFLAVILVARRSDFLAQRWRKLVLIPSIAVVLLALLQYTVLPHNFLSHFGYKTGVTIQPIETINHNSNYIRVQSTLRGANPLGAYLVIIGAATTVLLWHARRRLAFGVLGLASVLALYTTGSRSAWIGAALAIGVSCWLLLPSKKSRYVFMAGSLAVIMIATGLFVLLKHNVDLQNQLFHTQDNSKVAGSSNQAHASAMLNGIKGVAHAPLGDGPGTAGPASVYNTKGSVRIAEDYYVQIGQETGWLGLVLFVTILVLVGLELYQRIGWSPLALVLLASLAGIAFVNLLSHAWTDDTLAFLWWGLAGIALGTPPPSKQKKVMQA